MAQEPDVKGGAATAAAPKMSLMDLKTDADALKFVMGMAPDEEALFWCVCLPSCSHYQTTVGGIAFGKFNKRDDAEEEEEEEVQTRVQGIVTPLTGTEARKVLGDVDKLAIRWATDKKKKDKKGNYKRNGYLQALTRKDYRRQPTDERLAQHVGFCLIQFPLDRATFTGDRDVHFNRSVWPKAMALTATDKPTVRLIR